jgi:ABC-2 type transport system ATP-binding protein/lipopolysaccharide transport system ATP-binding protein
MTSGELAVALDDVSKRFWLSQERRTGLKERVVRGKARPGKAVWALKDASFEVPRGTTFGLVGHNGSGKSTALKVIAGIYRPTSGDVTVNGRLSALLELGAGFHPDLSGRENIRLNGSILGLSRRQVEDEMDEIIAFSGLEEFIDSPVKVYSSGMYVRLGFAIAVAVRPEILAIDEIIAVGDEEFQRKCFDHLHQLRHSGSTILLVSHSLALMEDLCDTAVWLDHGQVRAHGEARSVVREYINSVNERETVTGSPYTSQTPADMERFGSGEVRVDRVSLLDAEGHDLAVALPGQPLTVRMHYTAFTAVEEASFALALVHESGVTVARPSSHREGAWRIEPGSGTVDLTIPELSLLPGTFTIRTSIGDRGHVYDQTDRLATLKIRGSGDQDPGLVRLPAVWRPPAPEGD